MRRREPRDRILNIRVSENELNRLEHQAIKEHNYTATYCRRLLLDALVAEGRDVCEHISADSVG